MRARSAVVLRGRAVAVSLAIMALMSTVAPAASPEDAARAASIELYPTYNSVGLELAYSGDFNNDSTAEFVWRKAGEEKWHNGVDMTFDRGRQLVWASVWPLDEGQAIEVEVTLSDKDSSAPEKTVASTTTRRMVLETRGRKFYVSPKGRDWGLGSKDDPFKSIAHAAAVAKPGDTVYAMTGVYREGNLFRGLKGTAEKPVIFMAAPGEKPVLDGSVEISGGKVTFEGAPWDAPGEAGWQAGGDGVYEMPYRMRAELGYVAQDGARMFRYWSLDNLRGDAVAAKRAWYYDAEARKLYIRTGDDKSPDSHVYNISNHDTAAMFADSSYVVLRGFEIRYYGSACVTFGEGALGCTVIENVIRNAPLGVAYRSDKAEGCAVWRNEIYEKGLEDFTWDAIKYSNYPRQGVVGKSGRGASICYNTIHGWFDCVAPVTWLNPDAINLNRDLDLMFNTLYNSGDDAIEIDGGGVNVRIHGNTMRNVFAAISIAPVERGPLYVTRNDATYMMMMFKANVGGCTSWGATYCYQNSGYSLIEGKDYGGSAISFAPGESLDTYNKVFKNNAFIAKMYGVRCWHAGNTVDYNCYWHIPTETGVTFKSETFDPATGMWNGVVHPTLADFSKATGQETHGIYADPQFVSTPDFGSVPWRDFTTTPLKGYGFVKDASIGDMHLKDTSPCIDKGEIIRGINDEDYLGAAPDMGAFEAR